MPWVSLAIFAYFLLALVALVDKKILSPPLLNPLAYAFYASGLTVLALFLWFLDFAFLSPFYTILALLAGATFFVAIYFMYSAIVHGEVSRAVSIIGGLSPILVFIFSIFFLNEKFHTRSLIALSMLIIGSILLSFVKDSEKFKFSYRFFLLAFLAAFFFAASYSLTKTVFLETSFLNGFIWMRVGTLFCCLVVLLHPRLRQIIFDGSKGFSKKLTVLFFFNKGVSGFAHIILNYAVKLGSVAIINALQAVEYGFIFVLTLGFSYFLPHVFYESLAPRHLAPKMIGIVFVSLGVVLLFFGGV